MNVDGRFGERHVLVLTALAGLLVRLRQLSAGRSFWLDEVFVGLDLREQTLVQSLIDGSPRNQLAPAGFWAIGHASETFSSAEWWLRFFPFVSGCLLVVLAIVYAERHLASFVARWFAVAIAAFSPVLIHYSAEMKQYGPEAMVSMAAVLAVAERDRVSAGWRVLLGALFLSLSLPALILVPVLGVVWLGSEVLRSGAGPAIRRLALPGAVLLVVQVGLLAYALRVEPNNMTNFWAPAFAPLPTGPEEVEWWAATAISTADLLAVNIGIAGHELPDGVFSAPSVLLGVSFWAVIGFGYLAAGLERRRGESTEAGRHWWRTMPTVSIVLVSIVAAGIADAYPLRGRLMVHALPFLFVAAAHGVDLARARWVASASRARIPAVAVGVAALGFAAVTAVSAASLVASPYRAYDQEALLSHLATNHQGGERIIVAADTSQRIYEYYGPQVGLNLIPELYADPFIDGDALAAQAGDSRAWYFNGFIRDEKLVWVEEMASHPSVLEAVWAEGAVLLYVDPTLG